MVTTLNSANVVSPSAGLSCIRWAPSCLPGTSEAFIWCCLSFWGALPLVGIAAACVGYGCHWALMCPLWGILVNVLRYPREVVGTAECLSNSHNVPPPACRPKLPSLLETDNPRFSLFHLLRTYGVHMWPNPGNFSLIECLLRWLRKIPSVTKQGWMGDMGITVIPKEPHRDNEDRINAFIFSFFFFFFWVIGLRMPV